VGPVLVALGPERRSSSSLVPTTDHGRHYAGFSGNVGVGTKGAAEPMLTMVCLDSITYRN